MTISADDDDAVPAEELALADRDARLPWLEGEDDYEDRGTSTGRMIAIVLGGLLVLALLVAGGYRLLRERSDGPVLADGSTIEAPTGPYKEKPADPGGATAPGTGDTSFAVAEGRSPVSRVAPAPRPSIDLAQQGGKGAGGVGVQVGAYSSRARAEQGWQQLAGQHEVLSGVGHRVVEGTVDGSPVFRLQAVAGSAAGARELCAGLKAAGADCQVKD